MIVATYGWRASCPAGGVTAGVVDCGALFAAEICLVNLWMIISPKAQAEPTIAHRASISATPQRKLNTSSTGLIHSGLTM